MAERKDDQIAAIRKAQRFFYGTMAIGGALCCLAALWARDAHGMLMMGGTSAIGSLLWRTS